MSLYYSMNLDTGELVFFPMPIDIIQGNIGTVEVTSEKQLSHLFELDVDSDENVKGWLERYLKYRDIMDYLGWPEEVIEDPSDWCFEPEDYLNNPDLFTDVFESICENWEYWLKDNNLVSSVDDKDFLANLRQALEINQTFAVADASSMKLLSSRSFEKSHLTLGDYMKLAEIQPGTLLYLGKDMSDPVVVLVGHATPYIRPTVSDGEIGWDWENDYGSMRLLKVEIYEVKGKPPVDYVKLCQ